MIEALHQGTMILNAVSSYRKMHLYRHLGTQFIFRLHLILKKCAIVYLKPDITEMTVLSIRHEVSSNSHILSLLKTKEQFVKILVLKTKKNY